MCNISTYKVSELHLETWILNEPVYKPTACMVYGTCKRWAAVYKDCTIATELLYVRYIIHYVQLPTNTVGTIFLYI